MLFRLKNTANTFKNLANSQWQIAKKRMTICYPLSATPYILLTLLSLSLFSCNKKDYDPVPEDYESLFPWKGIEKPENSYEDMSVRTCNPNMALANYRYMGVDLEDSREYTITLTTTFTEAPSSFFISDSKYEVRYIDANKNIKVIGTNPANSSLSTLLRNGQPHTIEFKVRSGYPMYLSVNGLGNRASNIKATIRAVSSDGLIIVSPLSTEQYQNQEGVVQLTNPYCEYIILP